MNTKHRSFISIALCVFALVVLVGLTLAAPLNIRRIFPAFLFGFLIFFTDLYGIPLGRGYAALLPLMTITTYLTLGLEFAGWLAFLTSITYTIFRYCLGPGLKRQSPPDWYLFVDRLAINATMHTFSILISGAVFQQFAPRPPLTGVSVDNIGALLLMSASYFATTHVLAAFYFFLRSRADLQTYLSQLVALLLYEATPVAFAPLFALIYNQLGIGHFVFLTFALGLASIIAHSLDQTRQHLERRVQELDSLQEVGQALSASLELDTILTAVYKQVSGLMPTHIFYIALYDADKEEITFPFVVDEEGVGSWVSRPPLNGLTEYILRTYRPLLIRHDMEAVLQTLQVQQVGPLAASWLGVPLLAGDEILGVMATQSTSQSDLFDIGHQEVLMTIATQATVAIKNAYLYTRTDTALAQRVQEFDSILRTTQDGILLIDAKGIVLAANQAFIELMGLGEMPTVSGQSIRTWPHEADTLLKRIGYTAAEFKADCCDLEKKVEQRKQKQVAGSDRYFERTLTPVYEKDHHVTAWLFVFRDTTEEIKLEQLRQDMIKMLVHDLRSPLSLIKGSLDVSKDLLLEKNWEELQELLRFADISSDRMLKLVNDLLDIYQLESGKVPLQQEKVRIEVLLNDVKAQFTPLALDTEITIEVDIAPDLPPLFVDINYIGRILYNLVDNAFKFTPDNGRIRLWAQLDGDKTPVMMIVGVDDTGTGIPLNAQERLFQKFQKDFTIGGRRKGSGLGLSYCKLAVEAHSGEIWVESTGIKGEGSRFAMRLPVI